MLSLGLLQSIRKGWLQTLHMEHEEFVPAGVDVSVGSATTRMVICPEISTSRMRIPGNSCGWLALMK